MIAYILLCAALAGPADGRTEKLLDAIRQVESSDGKRLVGDDGRSLGAYQIGRAYWTDACQFGGVDWDYAHGVRDETKCRQVIRWYWQRYAARTDQHRARIHNGGPRGHLRASTLPYWRKVQAELDRGRR